MKALRCLESPVQRHALLVHRVAAAIEHAPVLRATGAATVIDIGANKGQFALAALVALPQCRVVSFEPLDGEADRFVRACGSQARVTLHRCAIGERDGTARIHVSARPDSSSLLPIGPMQSAMFPGTEASRVQPVRVNRLGSVISRADLRPPVLLKIDVQGYELPCLGGCDDLLDAIDWVYVECSFIELYTGQAMADQVISRMREAGFRLAGIHHVSRDRAGAVVQGDFLFRRDEVRVT